MAEGKLAKNYAFLSIGEALTKVFTFLSFTFLSRQLGPKPYGDLEFSLGAVTIFSLFVQMGLGSYGAREISKEPSRSQSMLTEIMAVRAWMSLISVAALVGFAAFINKSPEVKLLIVAYGASLLVVPAMTLWFFQGHDAMHWAAAANLIRHGAFACCVFAFYRSGDPMWWIGIFEAVSVTACVVFGYWVVIRKMGYRAALPSLGPRKAWAHFREALPIGLSNLTWAVLWLAPLVVMGLRLDNASLGWFAASHRMTMALHTFVWWYFFNLLPEISRSAGAPPQRLQSLMDRSLRIVCWGSVLAALGTTMLAPEALSLAFGERYYRGGTLLAGLIWCIPVAAISGHYRYMLIGYNLQQWLFVWTAISAAVTTLGAYLFAPAYGAAAGVWALLAGNVLCFGLCYATAKRRIQKIRFWGRLAPPAGAAAAAGALALTPLAENGWALAAAGTALYVSLAAWFQRRELPVLWRQFAARLT